MAKIRYVGSKEVKTDNVAGTGVVWFGKDDEQDVPDAAAPALLRHTTVWELVTPDGLAGAAAKSAESQAAKALDPITAEQMADLDDTALRELAEAHGLKKPHHTKKGDALREAILESQAAKA